MEQLVVSPIGYARTGMQTKFDAPHQPDPRLNRCEIELNGGNNFEQALRDLGGFQRIWIIWWFHRNTTWNPVVLPPRGQGIKRGVFSTRSPHRPNPLGITAVELFEIKKRTLFVGPLDLVDGTPVIDIKPYIPEVDAFPSSRAGWVDGLSAYLTAKFTISKSPIACEQIAWLTNEGVRVFHRAMEILAIDPTPNRTRRISRSGKGLKIGCGAWRLHFELDEGSRLVTVTKVTPGYPMRTLLDPLKDSIPDREIQLSFLQIWTNN